MTIKWTDQEYCGGFSYRLVLVSRDVLSPKHSQMNIDGGGNEYQILDSEIEDELNAIWQAPDDSLTFSGGVGYVNSVDWINPATGSGIWTVKLEGRTGQTGANGNGRGLLGQYSALESANSFTIKMINPCISSSVGTISLLPNDYSNNEKNSAIFV